MAGLVGLPGPGIASVLRNAESNAQPPTAPPAPGGPQGLESALRPLQAPGLHPGGNQNSEAALAEVPEQMPEFPSWSPPPHILLGLQANPQISYHFVRATSLQAANCSH